LAGHQLAVSSLVFSQNGRTLLSGSSDYTVLMWDVATQRLLGNLLADADQIIPDALALSPDGKILAIGFMNATVGLWDMATRKELTKPLSGHRRSISSIAFSPDGKVIASGSEDGDIILWDAAGHTAIGDPLVKHTELSAVLPSVRTAKRSPRAAETGRSCCGTLRGESPEPIRSWHTVVR
jgi:WD40 repeat protein